MKTTLFPYVSPVSFTGSDCEHRRQAPCTGGLIPMLQTGDKDQKKTKGTLTYRKQKSKEQRLISLAPKKSSQMFP